MNRKGVEYAVLQREVESSKESYASLLERSASQAAAAGDLRTSNVRIVDLAALPDRRSSRVTQTVLIALILGGFLAISAAFFFEYLDHRVKTPEAIETHLRLVSLGTIPRLSRKSRRAFATNRFKAGLPPEFRGSLPWAANERSLLVARHDPVLDCGHQRVATRGQDDGGLEPRRRSGPGGVSECC